MDLLTPAPWTDYQLIDTGGFEKLERFGQYILRRPEPQALWQKAMPIEEWELHAHASFFRNADKPDKHTLSDSNEAGNWQLRPDMPQQWWVNYEYQNLHLQLRLGLTSFKHVGLFPEQSENWNYIYEAVQQFQTPEPRVLNLFAYTGAASLAAKAAGADVVHVDSVKQVIHWSRQNMEASGLNNIRWVVEDALKFTEKEARRQNIYQGIILDPPAYGRGPNGEKWHLEKNIDHLLHLCSQILSPDGFLVINLYSLGLSALILENLIKNHFPQHMQSLQFGELYATDLGARKLPLGTFARFCKR